MICLTEIMKKYVFWLTRFIEMFNIMTEKRLKCQFSLTKTKNLTKRS